MIAGAVSAATAEPLAVEIVSADIVSVGVVSAVMAFDPRTRQALIPFKMSPASTARMLAGQATVEFEVVSD